MLIVLEQFLFYVRELFLPLFIGFLISGIFYVSIPTRLVERYLGQKGLSAIFISTFIGMTLPVCCFGSLPIAVTLRRKGARLGPVLAFLVATPATSVSAVLVMWKLMGAQYTMYAAATVVIMGLIIGLIGNSLKVESKKEESQDHCCHEDKKVEGSTIKRILVYAFYTLPKSIGFELLLGIILASVIVSFEAIQNFLQQLFHGFWGYLGLCVFGLVTYVCSTASVPIADAFVQSGLTQGQSMVYLLVGPITSVGTLLVINKEFGKRVLVVYLIVIVLLALIASIGYDQLV